MSLMNFILLFAFLVIGGSLSVTGWFFITRGWVEILPNGKPVKRGKLFNRWFFFWNRENGSPKKIYFEAQELYYLVGEMSGLFPDFNFENRGGTSIRIYGNYKDHQNILAQVSKKLDVQFSSFGGSDGYCEYAAFREYPVYVFPEWVRFPLACCSTCFASIYGSAFYWGAISLINENIFGWATSPVVACLFFWIVFCLTLAVINTALAKKYN